MPRVRWLFRLMCLASSIAVAESCGDAARDRELAAGSYNGNREQERPSSRISLQRNDSAISVTVSPDAAVSESFSGTATAAFPTDSLIYVADPTVCGVRVIERSTRRPRRQIGSCGNAELELPYVSNLELVDGTLLAADLRLQEFLAIGLDGRVLSRTPLSTARNGAAALSGAWQVDGGRLAVGVSTFPGGRAKEGANSDRQLVVFRPNSEEQLRRFVATPAIGTRNRARTINGVQLCRVGGVASSSVVLVSTWSFGGVVVDTRSGDVIARFRTEHELDTIRRASRGEGVQPPSFRTFVLCDREQFLLWTTYSPSTAESTGLRSEVALAELRRSNGALIGRARLNLSPQETGVRPLALRGDSLFLRVVTKPKHYSIVVVRMAIDSAVSTRS